MVKFMNKNNIVDNNRVIDILDNINGFSLDEHQRKVVLSEDEYVLVVAGAGSGKSLTIIGKIVYLVKVLGVKPEEILCISFTNEATDNLKKNITKNYNLNLDIYNFHKLALMILKTNNQEYTIAPDNFLEQLIDNFFDTIPTNQKLANALKKLSNSYIETKNLKRLLSTFINLFKSNNYPVTYFKEILRKIKFTIHYQKYKYNKNFLLLAINIYALYTKTLAEENALDFNDMINYSIKSIKNNGLKAKWKYIIIDEFQDTSLVKATMIQEIIKVTNAKLLVVGDDFQSIYRFTGCSLDIFLNFDKYFPSAKTFQIINTYRSPQEVINVSGKFIMKNKKQQKKLLYSNKHISKPIKIIYHSNNVKALKYSLNELKKESPNIMVLGRNNRDIDLYTDNDFKSLKNDTHKYNDIEFKYLTIHRSKGLEADNIIVINNSNDLLGLPTKIKNEDILKYVNKTKDYYPFEEERRLFYVALTRTKNYVCLLTPRKNPSPFIKEIEKNKKYIEVIKTD